jgi:putative spermidine/putrescine transport system ATP-binding protein
VRPERIKILGTGHAEQMNAIDMTVNALVNYGDSVLAIGTSGDKPLRMRVAGAPPPELREGARLRVGWAPQDAYAVERTTVLTMDRPVIRPTCTSTTG